MPLVGERFQPFSAGKPLKWLALDLTFEPPAKAGGNDDGEKLKMTT